MQDNKYSDLANKGWQEMEAVLDKEMPVRKRRLIPFLLLLGLISASVVTGMVYSKNHRPKMEQQPSEQKLPTINTADVIASDITNEVVITGSKQDKDSQDDSSKKSVAERVLNRSKQDVIDVAINNTTDHFEAAKYSNINSVVNRNDDSGRNSINDSAVFETSLRSPEANSSEGDVFHKRFEKNSIVQMRLKLDKITFLPLNSEIEFINNANNHLLEIGLPLTISKNMMPFKFNFIAGINVPVYGKMSGLELGFGTSKELSRRWSIASAVLFTTSRFKYGQSLVEYASNNTADVPITTAGEEASDPSGGDLFEENGVLAPSLFDQAVKGVNRLDYINVPLLIRYRVAMRHQLGIGGQYAYLLSSSNILIQQNPELLLGADRTEKSISKKVLNAQSVSLAANYNFLINKRFEIATKLNYGFSPIFNTTDRLEKNRIFNLTLSLRYNL